MGILSDGPIETDLTTLLRSDLALVADCPHCSVRRVSFSVLSGFERRQGTARNFELFAQCGHCQQGIIAVFEIDINALLNFSTFSDVDPVTTYPPWPTPHAPHHTPDVVAEFFVEGINNMSGNWNAAGVMFRRTLEEALKHKFPNLSGDLNSRIQKAAEQNKLTPELAEWAHKIRLEGNQAAHGKYEERDARQLSTLTEMVLWYLFTLPGMLKEKEGQIRSQQESKKERW